MNVNNPDPCERIEFSLAGSGGWVRWPESAHLFEGGWMTGEQIRRVVDHHNVAYPEYEFRIVRFTVEVVA